MHKKCTRLSNGGQEHSEMHKNAQAFTIIHKNQQNAQQQIKMHKHTYNKNNNKHKYATMYNKTQDV